MLTLEPGGEAFSVREGEPIMNAINRAGFSYWRGCRRGGCGVCVARVIEGSVTNERPVSEDVLSQADIDRGFIVTCRAVPCSDVVLRLRDDADLRCVSKLQQQIARRELDKVRSIRERRGA